ncbi:peptidase A4 family-domain-containing protein [Mycena pura]|uniref:Peptidase A4 family-domain-containing protein n=1 Tax=Mycena pura TaxID=153505 RepID=A0AAD6YH64_9AGAR|nr:peptidase A4 family-domain-containing protein [Mycena pura]
MFTALFPVLLATAVFARPSPGLEARLTRRRSGLKIPSNGPDNLVTNITNAEFSSNWAGAAFESPAGTFQAVTGTFTVPTPKAPSGGSGSFAASAWVGIDGDTCGTAILQTGLDFTVTNGRVSYDAWFEYFPAFATDFSGITISAGNQIRLTATVSTATSGTVKIENLSTGVTVSKSLTSSAKLCQENAEWIVEDFEEGSSLVPFANFGTVTFSNAVATMVSGATTGPSGAVIIDLEQNNQVLTSVSTSSSSVTVEYL